MKAQKLNFDDGMMRLDINGNGMLVFNPSDFNIYSRFVQLLDDLPNLEKKYIAQVEEIPEDAPEDTKLELIGDQMDQARKLDAEVKARLSAVFGGENDFNELLGGVNCMAFGANGERVITNLLQALQPYIHNGAKDRIKGAVAAAKTNREQRRAAQRK